MNKPLNIPHRNNRYTAVAMLVITSVLWSLGGVFIKWVDLHPIAIAGARSGISALVTLVFLRKPHFTWSFPQLGGAVAYSATIILFVIATKTTTAANAILLQYTAPIYVALMGAWFLKERTGWLDWVTIFCTMGSMVLFFIDEVSVGDPLGNVYAIISGVCFAGLVVFMRKQKDGSSMESILLGNILTAIIGIPFIAGSSPDSSDWFGLIILGVFQLGIPYILYSKAAKHVTALEMTLIPIIEPILNPFWVFLFMDEVPGIWTIIGGCLLLFFVTVRMILVQRGIKGFSFRRTSRTKKPPYEYSQGQEKL
jgi:drug/metabolite transporter (DMT)-like permease